MSTSFFIGSIDPSAWYVETNVVEKPTSNLQIDPDFYRTELLKKWPFAKVFIGENLYILSWNLDTEHELGPEGGLHSDCQHVSLKSCRKEILIDFVLWHRLLISANYDLYLYNSSSAPTHLVLTTKTSEQEIEKYLLNS